MGTGDEGMKALDFINALTELMIATEATNDEFAYVRINGGIHGISGVHATETISLDANGNVLTTKDIIINAR